MNVYLVSRRHEIDEIPLLSWFCVMKKILASVFEWLLLAVLYIGDSLSVNGELF